MEVLHLDFETKNVDWLSPVQTRLSRSSSSELQDRYSRWEEVGLGELALAVATRLTILQRVQGHLRALLQNLHSELEQWDALDEAIETEICFRTSEPGTPFDLCTGIDSLIFEFRSLYELLRRFAIVFVRQMLRRKVGEADILDAIRDASGNTEWVDLVQENRNILLHATAPWIALQIHQRRPLAFSLLVMKKNLREFKDPKDYITASQLLTAITGLEAAIPAVRSWLLDLLQETESELETTAANPAAEPGGSAAG